MAKHQRWAAAVIDDDPADVKLLRRHLEAVPEWQVELLPFATWAEARPALARRAVDVIFLDYVLGSETGLQALEEFRAGGDERPVIVLTGRGDEQIAAAICRVGADDYLVKRDLSPDLLRRAVGGAVERYRLRGEKALLEAELLQSQKMESVGALAAGIAHDFNNMLTGLMGNLELAAVKVRGREVEGNLDRALAVCQQMAATVQHLLTFSRREAVGREAVNLNRLVEDMGVFLRHAVSQGVVIELDLPPHPVSAVLNGALIQRVLMNLGLNAGDAMPSGGTLTLGLRRETLDAQSAYAQPGLEPGEHVCLWVRDTGVGMDEAVRRRVFEPFFTTKSRDNRKGTGLGLAVVWQNVKTHGGAVTVSSEPGQGSTFRVYLPIGRRGAEPPRPPRASGDLPAGAETVLVVDDDAAVRDLAAAMLQQLGYTVYLAPDGAVAVELYRELAPNVAAVVLDLAMPRMDGREALARLKAIDPGVRVLIASGQDVGREAEHLLAAGAASLLQKPFSRASLARQLRAVLDA